MAAIEEKQQADSHKNACRIVASTSQIQECRTLALALLDANKWLDANYSDLSKVFQGIESMKEAIEQLERRLAALEQTVRGIR